MIERLEEYFGHEGDGVLAAYLFGSRSRGRAHAESDVDVAVLLDPVAHPDRAARSEARERLGSALIAALHVNEVDVVVLNDAPPGLARAAIGGRRVHCADAARARDFERDVQLRAADLDPFLRRMAALKLEAIGR